MPHFEDFQTTYSPAKDCEKPTEDDVERYEQILPTALLDHWREVGWCAYGDGLLWLTNPQEFADLIDEWVDFESDKAVVFLRTAFAHLYLWHDGNAYSLDVQRGGLSQVTDDIELLFTLLTDDDIREKILRVSLFEEVKERLGPPGRDECYAFVPALALGGPGTPETVQKVKMREQLGILAQLVRG
jgi:hypothetical protein